MPIVLICSDAKLPDELKQTALWREDVERQVVRNAGEALFVIDGRRPNLVLVDSSLVGVEELVQHLRNDPGTRSLSIAVFARTNVVENEAQLLEGGANTILRLPPDAEWDERVAALMSVAPRRTSRLAVTLQFEATSGDDVLTVAGTVLNLSERGMLIETDVGVAVGTDIDFKIHLRDMPQPLVGCGHVVRHDGARRSGVQFYGLEADGSDRVRRFVSGRR